MWNPFKKAKKAATNKVRNIALVALISGILTTAAYRFELPIAKDTIDALAAALADAATQVMDEPLVEPSDLESPIELQQSAEEKTDDK